MPKIFVAQGVGHEARPFTAILNDHPEQWRKWPYILIWNAASGNVAQILPPSGNAGALDYIVGHARQLHAFPQMASHKPLSWKNNKLLIPWRDSLNSTGSDFTFSWHPYLQDHGSIVNGTNAIVDSNTNFNSHLMFDGRNYEIAIYRKNNIGGTISLPTAESIFWCKQVDTPSYLYGMIRGINDSNGGPFPVDAGPPISYLPNMGNYGNPGSLDIAKFQTFHGVSAGGFVGMIGGINYQQTDAEVGMPTDITLSPCDMVEYNGSWYIASQTAVWCVRPGTKGALIHSDYWDNRQDEFGGDTTVGLGNVDLTRNLTGKGDVGIGMRSFVVHNGSLLMLNNNGKLFKVYPQGLSLLSNIQADGGTHFASGIVGGGHDITPLVSAGGFPSPGAYRPFCASFKGKLHAFLNYELTSTQISSATGEGIAKASDSTGKGKGVCWFVSSDNGRTWTDNTTLLPASGILTPNGNTTNLGTWLQAISPYRFSGRYAPSVYPSGYGTGVNHLGQSAPISPGDEVFPSGYRQATGLPIEAGRFAEKADRIPYWASGMLDDVAGTPFNALSPALDKGMISGFLYPTLVDYPSGFAYVQAPGGGGGNVDSSFDPKDETTWEFVPDLVPPLGSGVWRAVGQSHKGWDFTGVRNRHIAGYVDYDTDPANPKILLYFSDSTPGTAGGALNAAQSATLFYDIDKNNNVIQKNYVHWAGQMAGYIPIDLYDPEIIIPSGSTENPNPNVNPATKMAKIKFHILDWGRWSKCDVKCHYSVDGGLNWSKATISGQLTNLSAGTPLTDPSGMGHDPNQYHEVYWLYGRDVGNGEFYPNTRIRMRAESVN